MANGMLLAVGLVLFLTVTVGPAVGQTERAPKWTPTDADRLRKDILKDYDPTLRPAPFANVTTVETSVTITHVEINELKSIFSMYGWMKFNWKDGRLLWEPASYGNISTLYLNQSALWTPTEESAHTLVKISNTGSLDLTVAYQKQTKCSIDWQAWPFDTQHCKMLFAPWIAIENDMEIHVSLIKATIDKGSLWTLNNLTLETHSYSDESEPLSLKGTHLHFVMKRNAGIYHSTIIAPACLLVLMNLIGFWLPPKCGEKLTLNAINLLLSCMFLIHFNETISYYTNSTPSIVLFFSQSSYLSCVCLMMTVLIECMLNSNTKLPVHPLIKKIISLDAVLFFITTNKQRYLDNLEVCETLEEPIIQQPTSDAEEQPSPEPSGMNHERDWILFSTVLTRFAFLIYVLIFTIMMIHHF